MRKKSHSNATFVTTPVLKSIALLDMLQKSSWNAFVQKTKLEKYNGSLHYIPSKIYEHNILERESILDIGYSFSFLYPAIKVLNSLDHKMVKNRMELYLLKNAAH